MLLKDRLTLPMCDPFHPDPVMCGSAQTGSIPETGITGAKDPGRNQGKVGTGNQDIGKTTIRATNGIREAGSDKC